MVAALNFYRVSMADPPRLAANTLDRRRRHIERSACQRGEGDTQ
jgi:hypothetical protein